MKVTDQATAEWLKSQCGCGCKRPVCSPPRIEAESISVGPCGFNIPAHPKVTAEFRCLIYSAVRSQSLVTSSYDFPGSSGNDVQTTSCTERAEFVTETGTPNPTRECRQRKYTDASVVSKTINKNSGGDVIQEENQTQKSSSGPGAACNSTVEGSVVFPFRPEDNYSYGPEPGGLPCTCPTPYYIPGLSGPIANNFEFAGGVFSLSSSPGNGTTVVASIAFIDPVTVASLKAEITTREGMAGMWQSASPGSNSKVTFTFGYPDPSEGEEPPEDPEPVCKQVTNVTKVRKRYGIPGGFEGKYYRMEAEEYFFPEKWDEWRDAMDDYEDAVAAKAEWDKCVAAGGGDCGPAPEVPDSAPEEPEEKPEKIKDVVFEWLGSGDEFGAWIPQDIPDETADPGENRIVNMQVRCYKSARLGVLPTLFGETYKPDE